MGKTFTKDPAAVLDYGFDWSSWLATGETLLTSTWAVPVGITKDSDTTTIAITTIWLSGGSAGSQYRIHNTVTTTGLRTERRSFEVSCEER